MSHLRSRNHFTRSPSCKPRRPLPASRPPDEEGILDSYQYPYPASTGGRITSRNGSGSGNGNGITQQSLVAARPSAASAAAAACGCCSFPGPGSFFAVLLLLVLLGGRCLVAASYHYLTLYDSVPVLYHPPGIRYLRAAGAPLPAGRKYSVPLLTFFRFLSLPLPSIDALRQYKKQISI